MHLYPLLPVTALWSGSAVFTYLVLLTLVMLNKLRCHTHFKFSAKQITWSKLFIQIQIPNDKQCRSRSVGFFRSQLIWIYPVCKGRVYPGSAGQGLRYCNTHHAHSLERDSFCFVVFESIGSLVLRRLVNAYHFGYKFRLMSFWNIFLIFSQRTGCDI